MTRAKPFRDGQGQAVRLPRAFAFLGREVVVRYVGNAIDRIKNKPERAVGRPRALDTSTVGVTSISVAELQYGFATNSRPEQDHSRCRPSSPRWTCTHTTMEPRPSVASGNSGGFRPEKMAALGT
jgi:hypothetical protein